jgi:hypothetical protein
MVAGRRTAKAEPRADFDRVVQHKHAISPSLESQLGSRSIFGYSREVQLFDGMAVSHTLMASGSDLPRQSHV